MIRPEIFPESRFFKLSLDKIIVIISLVSDNMCYDTISFRNTMPLPLRLYNSYTCICRFKYTDFESCHLQVWGLITLKLYVLACEL